ncbi:MAG TPA: hypothetical protein PLW65_33715, partial [Pseudomonadota bacterium]|nr:hypothetical protein [Pseudomonadota bacterium]
MSSASAPRPVSPSQQVRARYRRVRTQAATTATEVLGDLRVLAGSPVEQRIAPSGPPGSLRAWLHQVAQGLLQPLHAARLLAGDRELLGEALLPALLLLGFCLGAGFLDALASDEPGFLATMLKTGLRSFAVL